MADRKTHDVFIEEMLTIHPTIEIKDIYYNNSTKVTCLCQKCNTVFLATPNSLLSKHGCPTCNDTKMTLEVFKDRLDKVNKNIEVIGKYINTRTKILCRCKLDGNEWCATPDSLLRGHGCKKCGTTFSRRATNALKKNYGCSKCNKSRGENRIEEFLINNNINYCAKKEFDDLLGIGGRKLSFDFYLPQKNMLIEYQGEFHDGTAWQQSEESYQKQQENDARKKVYAKENRIDLLEIWYWEFEKINSILFDAVFGGELDDTD